MFKLLVFTVISSLLVESILSQYSLRALKESYLNLKDEMNNTNLTESFNFQNSSLDKIKITHKNEDELKIKTKITEDQSNNSISEFESNSENNNTNIFTTINNKILKLFDVLNINIGEIWINNTEYIIKGKKIYYPLLNSENQLKKQPVIQEPINKLPKLELRGKSIPEPFDGQLVSPEHIADHSLSSREEQIPGIFDNKPNYSEKMYLDEHNNEKISEEGHKNNKYPKHFHHPCNSRHCHPNPHLHHYPPPPPPPSHNFNGKFNFTTTTTTVPTTEMTNITTEMTNITTEMTNITTEMTNITTEMTNITTESILMTDVNVNDIIKELLDNNTQDIGDNSSLRNLLVSNKILVEESTDNQQDIETQLTSPVFTLIAQDIKYCDSNLNHLKEVANHFRKVIAEMFNVESNDVLIIEMTPTNININCNNISDESDNIGIRFTFIVDTKLDSSYLFKVLEVSTKDENSYIRKELGKVYLNNVSSNTSLFKSSLLNCRSALSRYPNILLDCIQDPVLCITHPEDSACYTSPNLPGCFCSDSKSFQCEAIKICRPKIEIDPTALCVINPYAPSCICVTQPSSPQCGCFMNITNPGCPCDLNPLDHKCQCMKNPYTCNVLKSSGSIHYFNYFNQYSYMNVIIFLSLLLY